MKKYLVLLAIAFCINGCALMQKFEKKDAESVYRQAQTINLETAKKLLMKNKVNAATDMLAKICSDRGVPGVTDEALFRLALIYLGSDEAKNEDVSDARDVLERLEREYPDSSWRPHATAVLDLMGTLSRRIKSLKVENQTLERKNKTLRLNIEKLKILDIEQDLKTKR